MPRDPKCIDKGLKLLDDAIRLYDGRKIIVYVFKDESKSDNKNDGQ